MTAVWDGPSLRTPIYPGYVWRYRDEYQYLVEELIPVRGSAPTIQGELIRVVDKLWFEGQDNENINWDQDFEYFVDFLEYYLLEQRFLDIDDRLMVDQDIAILRHCGHIAFLFKPEWARPPNYDDILRALPAILAEPDGRGEYPDLAYTHSDVYEHLMDCVILFIHTWPDPVPYSSPPWLTR